MKTSALRIIPMKPSHVRACESIVADSNPWKRLRETLEFRSAVSRARSFSRAYVCLAGDEPAGFVVFVPEPVFARGGYLRAIAVAPGARGKGVGKKMLSFAEKETARKCGHLFLCVSSFNRPARAFYRACGYTRAGSLPGLIRPGETEHIFWKKLNNKSS